MPGLWLGLLDEKNLAPVLALALSGHSQLQKLMAITPLCRGYNGCFDSNHQGSSTSNIEGFDSTVVVGDKGYDADAWVA
jgi:hypothetical protein